MKIELKHITVKDIFNGYLNDDENNGGVVGYGELLNIRPAYQRNYVYKDKQRDKVIDTVLKGLPLNVMYWVHNEDDTYEVLDGQQRTISICDFVNGDFSVLWNGKTHYFYTLTEDVKKKILEYELTVYICEGTDSEKLDWFQTINIAGEKLLDQELRNAVYYGPWLADAKRFFSKRDCIAKRIGERYMVGDPNRQQYLETVLRWVSNDDINKYMAEHKNLPNANQLTQYFRNMVAWLNDTFEYRKEMCGVPWGPIYNEHQNDIIDTKALEEKIASLMMDEDVTNKKGIYEYVFDSDERHLSIRAFDMRMKREVYERQKGICPHCKQHFDIKEMEADHITPWSEGGTTTIDNCQMLCKDCNRKKSNK